MWDRARYAYSILYASLIHKSLVPVVVVFTKFDAFDNKAFGDIKRENPGISYEDVIKLTPLRAEEDFQKLQPTLGIFTSSYPPKDFVCLRGRIFPVSRSDGRLIYLPDMDKPTSSCFELLDRTAAVLDDDVLQVMFVSAQQCNLKLCTKYAMK